ncbi:MAG: hypothetical protein Q7S31_03825 [bacterium]|nr:hypothetical protein [bacterium]
MEPTSKLGNIVSSVWFLILVAVTVVGAGVGTAFMLVNKRTTSSTSVSSDIVDTGKVVGLKDSKAFPDSAQGVLEAGGINGEGTHKLIREGGPSQTAYLVSSVVDLDEFTGKKIEVWGQTMDGNKAGWLMDVGLVKILE